MRKALLWLLCSVLLCGCSSGKEKASDDGSRTGYSCRYINYIDFTEPVPENTAVDDSWFADALFIGDARVASLYNYSSLREEGADVHYITGLNKDNMDTQPADTFDGNASMLEIMQTTEKSNIFLMIGFNDLNLEDYEGWIAKTSTVTEKFRSRHMDASIYLILPYAVSATDGLEGEQLQNQLQKLREAMQEIAAKYHYYCIDAGEALNDSTTGVVKEEYVWDGSRLNEEGTSVLLAYIARHVVRNDVYVKYVCS